MRNPRISLISRLWPISEVGGGEAMTAAITAQQRMPVFAPDSSAIAVSRIADPALLSELSGLVHFYFSGPTSDYVDMDSQAYRQLVAEAQDQLNRRALPPPPASHLHS